LEEKEDMTDPAKPGDYKPPATVEEEEQRFTAFLGKFLEEDDETPSGKPPIAPPVAPPVSSASSQPVDISAQINAALEARDKAKQSDERYENLSKEVAALKAPKRKKWWEPWSLFSDS
jgi:hypothetical protein